MTYDLALLTSGIDLVVSVVLKRTSNVTCNNRVSRSEDERKREMKRRDMKGREMKGREMKRRWAATPG